MKELSAAEKYEALLKEFQILAQRYNYEDLHCFYTLSEDLLQLVKELLEKESED